MLCLHSDLFIFLLLLFIVWHLLFFYRTNNESIRTGVQKLRVYEIRIEAQKTSIGRGGRPGQPVISSYADDHDNTGSVVVSIPIPQGLKENCTAHSPSICIKVPTFIETATNIILISICCVTTC